MSPDREVTIGEVADKVDALARDVRGYQADNKEAYADKALTNERIANLTKDVVDNNKRHEEEVRELEGRLTIIGRTAITAVLLPILVLIIIGIINSGVKP